MLIIVALLEELVRVGLNTKFSFDWKKQNIAKHKTLFSHIKIGEEILMFADAKVENDKFYCYKSPIFIEDVDINNVLVSNKIAFGEKNFKYFIGYGYDDYI